MSTLTAPPTAAALGRVFPDDYPPRNIHGITLSRWRTDLAAADARELPPEISPARRFARAYAEYYRIPEGIADDLLTCISEMAGNVRHAIFPAGRPHFFVQLRMVGPFVVARVLDPDLTLPCVYGTGPVSPDAESGRGLSEVVPSLSARLWFGPVARGALKAVECWIPLVGNAVPRFAN